MTQLYENLLVGIGGNMKKIVLIVFLLFLSFDIMAQDSEEKFKSIVKSVKGRIYAEYNKALKDYPGMKGKVEFNVSINQQGNLNGCYVLSSEVNNVELEDKICNVLKSKSYQALPKLPYETKYAITLVSY